MLQHSTTYSLILPREMTPSSPRIFYFSSPLLSPFFSLVFLSSFLSIFLATEYNYPQNCQPKSCGNLTTVTFPFRPRELQPDHCGLPSFELWCEDETSKLIMAPEDYNVLDISYERRTATVSLAKFAELLEVLIGCQTMKVCLVLVTMFSGPVVSSPDPNVKQYAELLANGFLLNWTAPDCSDCVEELIRRVAVSL